MLGVQCTLHSTHCTPPNVQWAPFRVQCGISAGVKMKQLLKIQCVHTTKCTLSVWTLQSVLRVCGDPACRGESVQSVEAFWQVSEPSGPTRQLHNRWSCRKTSTPLKASALRPCHPPPPLPPVWKIFTPTSSFHSQRSESLRAPLWGVSLIFTWWKKLHFSEKRPKGKDLNATQGLCAPATPLSLYQQSARFSPHAIIFTATALRAPLWGVSLIFRWWENSLKSLKGKLGDFFYYLKVIIQTKLREVSTSNFHQKALMWVKKKAKG